MSNERPDRMVLMSAEFAERMFTRDAAGNRLRLVWGEPKADGTYEPLITVDYDDNLRRATVERCKAIVEQVYQEQGRVHPGYLPFAKAMNALDAEAQS